MNVYGPVLVLFSLYKAIYSIHVGTGSFFKAHKDTPRSTDMFGSLVIVFPAPHEGGALVLRHGGDETAFDSGAMLKDAKEPSIAYVAFFSDVKHEVLPVTAGHRVTITYNLYFRELPSQARDPTQSSKIYRTLPPTENAFLVAFQQLLADPMFLPNGGVLGFGLSHEYPVPKEQKDLNFLKDRLKGRDALVMKACQDFSLPVAIKVVYEEEASSGGVEILCSIVCRPNSSFCDEDETYWQFIKQQDDVDAKIISVAGDSYGPDVDFPVHWVTKYTDCNGIRSEYAAFECYTAALRYLYGGMCLIVEIGPPGARRSS